MRSFLLDTSAFLFAAFDDSRLSGRARALLEAGSVAVSHVSAIEMAIKFSSGRLDLPEMFHEDFQVGFDRMADEMAAETLNLSIEDIAVVSRLPLHHRDPFDRLLIAQAIRRTLTVVTSDWRFSRYAGLDVLEI